MWRLGRHGATRYCARQGKENGSRRQQARVLGRITCVCDFLPTCYTEYLGTREVGRGFVLPRPVFD
jgi:hypothetical protein